MQRVQRMKRPLLGPGLLGELLEEQTPVEAELARARETSLRQQADANANRAQTAAAKSEQVAQFLKDMLHGVGPKAVRILGDALRAADLRSRGCPGV